MGSYIEITRSTVRSVVVANKFLLLAFDMDEIIFAKREEKIIV